MALTSKKQKIKKGHRKFMSQLIYKYLCTEKHDVFLKILIAI